MIAPPAIPDARAAPAKASTSPAAGPVTSTEATPPMAAAKTASEATEMAMPKAAPAEMAMPEATPAETMSPSEGIRRVSEGRPNYANHRKFSEHRRSPINPRKDATSLPTRKDYHHALLRSKVEPDHSLNKVVMVVFRQTVPTL